MRNFADLPAVLSELGRVLRPGGRLALLEVGEPRHRLVRLGHRLWFTHGVPRLGALFSDGAAYRYLPRSVAYLPSFSSFAALLDQAGFCEVRRHLLSGGIAQCVTRDPMRRGHPLMTRSMTSLCYAVRPIGAQLVDQLRRHAYETGHVIEREGLIVLGLGTASALELPGGPANPPALRRAVTELRAIPRLEERSLGGGAGPGRRPDLEAVPVALGALRFDRSADGALVVPEVTVVAAAGSEPSVVVVGPPDRVRQLLSSLPGSLAVAQGRRGELAPR